VPQVSDVLYVTAGQTVSLRAKAGYAGTSLDGGTTTNVLTIVGVNAPTTISATETVSCRYTGSDGASLSATPIIVKGQTKDWDSHGMFNATTGVLTLPVAGKYSFVCSAGQTAQPTANNQSMSLALRTGSVANAGTVKQITYINATNSVYINTTIVSGTISGNAGDTFTFQATADIGAARTLQTDSAYVNLTVTREGG
jgi:hypothetical protein